MSCWRTGRRPGRSTPRNEKTPTPRALRALAAPRGVFFILGRPGDEKTPTPRALRALAAEGALFILGRPGDEKCAPWGAFVCQRELLRVRLDRGGQRELVAAAFVADALAECPDAAFEVQRDQRHVVQRDLGGLLQQRFALGCVHRHDGLLVDLVEIGVGEAAVVAGAQAVGRIQRGHPQLEQRRSLARFRRPAAHREAEFALGALGK